MNEFTKWLVAERKSRNLTQDELAVELKVHTRSISLWESGKGTPNRNMTRRLAEYFGVLPEVLLEAVRGRKMGLKAADRKSGAMMLPPILASRIERLASRSSMSPDDWLDKMLASMERQAQTAMELMPDIAGKIGIKDGNRIAAKNDDPKKRQP